MIPGFRNCSNLLIKKFSEKRFDKFNSTVGFRIGQKHNKIFFLEIFVKILKNFTSQKPNLCSKIFKIFKKKIIYANDISMSKLKFLGCNFIFFSLKIQTIPGQSNVSHGKF